MPTDQKISDLAEDTAVTPADFVAIVTPGYAQTRKASLANIMALGVSANYARSSPATRQIGGVNIGDSLTGLTWDQIAEKMLAPYTAPTITNTVLTPAQSPYNQQNVTYNVTFRWVQNVGTPNLIGYQVKYRRGNTGSWVNLTTTLNTITTSMRDASATLTINTTTIDNSDVQFKCEFIDGQSNDSAIATATFAAYAAPGISFSLNGTQKEFGAVNNRILGTITQNTPNIALTSYQIQYQVNSAGSWIDYGTPTAVSGATPGILIIHNDTTLATSISLNYRVKVTDAQQDSYSAPQAVTYFYRLWYDALATVPATSADVRNITDTQLSNAGNTFTISTGTSLTRFVIVLPPGKTLVSVIDQDALNLNITTDYASTSIAVDDIGGISHTYTLYAKTQSVPYSANHRHNITIA